MKVIAFVGQAGEGKTTCQQIVKSMLEQQGHVVTTLSFATILKEFCGAIFSSPSVNVQASFYETDLKDRECLYSYNEGDSHATLFSPREAMTSVAEAVKKLDRSAFANALVRQMRELSDVPGYIIIDDLRMIEELRAVEQISDSAIIFLNPRKETLKEKISRYLNFDANPSERGLHYHYSNIRHMAIDNNKKLGYNVLESKLRVLVNSNFCPEEFYSEVPNG